MVEGKPQFDQKQINTFCDFPFARAKVCCDGQMNFCCHQHFSSNLGSLFEHKFEDLWFGQFAEEIRAETLKGNLHKVCDTTACPHQYKDRGLWTHNVNQNGYPLHLEFDLHGSHCNFGGTKPRPDTVCIMCPRAKPDWMDYLNAYPDRTEELAKSVKHILPYLTSMHILGVAEPFWKNRIFDVLDWLEYEDHRDRITVWTTCNGSVFDEEKQNRFAELVPNSFINFSTDAATPETYLKIRRQKEPVFHKVVENITRWCKNRPSGHIVHVHNNINIFNVHEVPDMVRLCKKMGVDRLVLLNTHDSTHPEITYMCVNQQNVGKFKAAQEEATRVAEEIGLNIFFTRPLTLDYDPELVQIKLV
jgi:hypothetical protein